MAQSTPTLKNSSLQPELGLQALPKDPGRFAAPTPWRWLRAR